MQKIIGSLCFFLLFAWTFDIKTTLIWVRTQDHQTISLERWKIAEIGVLESLLSCQRKDNSKDFPIKALMCTSHDLAVISYAFDRASEGLFTHFPDEYLHSLAIIAAQLEAIGILILCVQKSTSIYESFFAKILEKVKQYCNRVEYYPLGKSPIWNVSGFTCSLDGTMLLMRGKQASYVSEFQDEDSIIMFDIATQTALRYVGDSENGIFFPPVALSGDGSEVVSVQVDDENCSCVVIIDVKSGSRKNIIVDDRIVSGEHLRRPINVITFNPLCKNEFFIECFGYLGKLIVHERDIEQENFTDAQIQLLYQLYLSAVSGHTIRLYKDMDMYYVYESLAPHMQKMVREEFGVEIS